MDLNLDSYIVLLVNGTRFDAEELDPSGNRPIPSVQDPATFEALAAKPPFASP